jgi:hypothetical protein
MARYRFPAFVKASTPRWVAVFDLQWRVIESQHLDPATDLSAAMAAAIARLDLEGWHAEATPEYGFVFIRCQAERRLLMLTQRDPYDTTQQSFDPFKEPQGAGKK